MNQPMKKALQAAFEAPPPRNKHIFLRSLRQPPISYAQFVLIQAFYIRKRVWGLSFLIFTASLLGACFMEKDLFWVISALIPYLAVSAVAENARSDVYGMSELEMASRFSLKIVILARMGILAISHFLLLCLLIPLGHRSGASTMLQTGVYLTVPYLLTTSGGLWILRKINGREGIYACLGIAVIISTLHIVIQNTIFNLYQAAAFPWWTAILTGLILLTVFEYRKTIYRTEELI